MCEKEPLEAEAREAEAREAEALKAAERAAEAGADPRSPGEDPDEEHGPLVERLRRLEWPPVDPEFRERAWERFQELWAELERRGETGPPAEMEQQAEGDETPPAAADAEPAEADDAER
jgi:hypothetical protein